MKPPFEQLVEQHSATVFRVCRSVVGPVDADDAWSETFISALRAYPDLPEDANVEAWLVRIAHRKGIDLIRARNRNALPMDTVPERATTKGNPGDWDHGLWAALSALPPKQQQAVIYHYIGGLPYTEVAEKAGGTATAARRAAADGMKALRTTYSGAIREGERK